LICFVKVSFRVFEPLHVLSVFFKHSTQFLWSVMSDSPKMRKKLPRVCERIKSGAALGFPISKVHRELVDRFDHAVVLLIQLWIRRHNLWLRSSWCKIVHQLFVYCNH
jgi:hypothetical protein